MISSVIFDLDCTLADRRQSLDRYLDRFLAAFGDELKTSCQAVRDTLEQADGGGYRADRRAADIVAHLQWTNAPDVAAVDEHWITTFPDCTVAMDGAYDVLDELREAGLALGILTNGSVTAQEAKIAHLHLGDRVDAVIVSEAVGVKKPDARIFEAALDALDVAAEACVYVGDHPVNDVQGAGDAGLTPVWLRGWQDWPAEQAQTEHVIDSLTEVPPLLDTLSEANL